MLKNLLAELKRRHVIRVASVYVVVAWAILRGAENFFPALTLPAWTVTFVAVLLLIGLPITLIIAWAFEITPEGIRRTPTATVNEPLGARDRFVELTLLAGVVLITGLSIFELSRPNDRVEASRTAGNTADRSLAVLPFTSFSSEPDSNYFADGLTEELIHDVAQIAGLKVSGRTSAFYFKNRNEDLRDIGRQLGVANVLEGSVRRDGDRLRITVQLISTADGFHLWSQTYDRRMNDVFAIQEDVASNVAAVLETTLVGRKTRPAPTDPTVYRELLIASALLRSGGLESLTQARMRLQTILDQDPDNVAALASYAQATILLAAAYLTIDFETASNAATAAVRRALELAPDSVDANIAAGVVYTTLLHRTDVQGYRAQAEQALAHAVALSPADADALTAYGSLLNESGRPADALKMLRGAVDRDPLSRAARFQYVIALEGTGQLAAARAQLERLIEREPNAVGARLELGELLAAQGQWLAALPWLRQAHAARTNPRASFMLANAYLNLGLEDAVARTVAETDYAPITAPMGQVILLEMRNDDAAALELAQQQLATTSDPIWRPLIVASALIVGDLDTARSQLESLEPRLFAETPVDVAELTPDSVLYAANLFMRTGEPARAQALLETLLTARAAPAGGYDAPADKLVRAKALAQLGRNDAAMQELAAAQLQGFRSLWDFDYFQRLDRLPWFAGLRDDARFRAFVAAIDADNRAMAARCDICGP